MKERKCTVCGETGRYNLRFYFDEGWTHTHNADCDFGQDCGGQVEDDFTDARCFLHRRSDDDL